MSRAEYHADFRGSVPPNPVHAYDLMRKWNIKFSGARQEDPDAFLSRILLRVMPLFLPGIALNSYRRSKGLWRTYADFAHACRARFGDPDFQFELKQEIYSCTQGESESVAPCRPSRGCAELFTVGILGYECRKGLLDCQAVQAPAEPR